MRLPSLQPHHRGWIVETIAVAMAFVPPFVIGLGKDFMKLILTQKYELIQHMVVFAKNIHQHVHEKNNVLSPRVIALEQSKTL